MPIDFFRGMERATLYILQREIINVGLVSLKEEEAEEGDETRGRRREERRNYKLQERVSLFVLMKEEKERGRRKK